jgi:hypothetical protein
MASTTGVGPPPSASCSGDRPASRNACRRAGIVVARVCDDRLRYAAAAVPGLTVFTYQVNFELVPAPEVTRL